MIHNIASLHTLLGHMIAMNQPENPIDIAILGAGIGGLALAIGLSERGIPVTLYEAANEFSPIGGK